MNQAFQTPHGNATATGVTLDSSLIGKKKACDSQQGVLEARLRRGHDADPGNAFPRKGKEVSDRGSYDRRNNQICLSI